MNRSNPLRRSRQAVTVISLRMVGTGLRFLLQVGLARWLGPMAFGRFTLVFTASEMAGSAALLGQPQVGLRFLPVHGEEGDRRSRSALIRRAVRTVTLLALGMGILLSMPPISRHLMGDSMVAGVALVILPYAAAGLLLQEGLLTGDGRVVKGVAVNDLGRPLIALVSLATLTAVTEPSVGPYLLITGAGSAALALWALATLRPLGPAERPSAQTLTEWRRTAGYGYLASLSLIVFYQSDIIIIGLLLSPTDAGIYTIATRLAALGLLPLRGIESVAIPKLARALGTGDYSEARRTARRSQQASLALGGGVCAGLAAVGHWLVRLFGEEYAGAYPLMLILLIGVLSNAATGSLPDVVWVSGRNRLHGTVLATHAGVNVAASVVAAILVGTTGVAAATALTNVSWNVAMAGLARHNLRPSEETTR